MVENAPDGPEWLHEIKFDGYRIHVRLDAGRVQILTRRGNDWTDKYPAIAKAIARLPAENAPGVLADAAYALASFGEDIDAMMALVDRALAFNPSFARGWHISGFLRLWAGQADLALEHAEKALQLSPRAQAGESSWLIGAALFFSRRFEEAVSRLRVRIEDMPLFPTAYRFLAACYAHMGRLDEARATIARLRAITFEVIPNYPLPFRDPGHRELYLSGLRLAMRETE